MGGKQKYIEMFGSFTGHSIYLTVCIAPQHTVHAVRQCFTNSVRLSVPMSVSVMCRYEWTYRHSF